jgi:hypothetical protein
MKMVRICNNWAVEFDMTILCVCKYWVTEVGMVFVCISKYSVMEYKACNFTGNLTF